MGIIAAALVSLKVVSLALALGLLVLLATRALPEENRVRGAYKWVVYGVSGAAILFGLVGGVEALGLI